MRRLCVGRKNPGGAIPLLFPQLREREKVGP